MGLESSKLPVARKTKVGVGRLSSLKEKKVHDP